MTEIFINLEERKLFTVWDEDIKPLMQGSVIAQLIKQYLKCGSTHSDLYVDRLSAKFFYNSVCRQEGGGGGGGGGGGSQTRLQLGMFTVYPAYAVVSPGNQAVVQVDCLPEAIGRGDEVCLTIVS